MTEMQRDNSRRCRPHAGTGGKMLRNNRKENSGHKIH